MGPFFITCILVLVGVSSLISTGDIIEGNKKGLKAITRRGWAMIVLNFCIILFSVIQYYTNEYESKIKDSENRVIQEDRDNSLKAKYDSALFNIKREFDKSSLQSISTVSEVLGKYGFRLDSTNKTLVKLISDSKVEQDAPVLRLRNDDGIKYKNHINNLDNFSLGVCSYDASSTDYDCFFYIMKEDTLENISLIGIDRYLNQDLSINKNQFYDIDISIPDSILYRRLIVVIKGTYKNMDKTKIYSINNANFYDKKTKEYKLPSPAFKEKIEKFIKQINWKISR